MTQTGTDNSSQTSVEKSLTGIEGFDQITRGGIPRQRTTLVIGGPGAGKTIFALQALHNGAAVHSEPAIFVAFEESADQIFHNASTFGWNLEELERERLFFLDARISPSTLKTGQFDLQAILAGLTVKVQEMNAKRIVFDGLDVLLTLLDDEAAERREAYRLHQWLKETGLTGIITAKSDQRDRMLSERYGFMQFMVDCVVGLQHRMQDRVSLRSLRVLKYRGSGFDEGEFPLVITEEGIEIATFNTKQLDFNVSTERVSTGIDRLDHMLDGGYHRGSSIIITGVPGTTKTTLASTYSVRMCEQGEKVLFVSFDESGAQIVRNLKSVGLDLQSFIDDGTLTIHAVRTEARSAEEHFIELKRMIRDLVPRHIVLDPVSALIKTGGQLSAMHAAFRLLDYAKCRGITVICTSLIGSNETPDIATNMDISSIADTWIHLAYRVLGGERNRTIGIVKSRGTAHSNQVRELTVTRAGLDLKDVYAAGGEVLVGTARHEKEAANRSVRRRRELELQLRRAQLGAVQAELAARIEALRLELEAKQTEVELFENEVQDAELGEADLTTDVRRLRSADTGTAQ